MKKAIRCFLSCILPCGSLDVIRIVHANGRVEEISGSIRASEVMKAYPKHVLKNPNATFEHSIQQKDGAQKRIVILPPDAQLERGKIYFLTPLPPVPPSKSARQSNDAKLKAAAINNNNSKKHHQMINDDDQVEVEVGKSNKHKQKTRQMNMSSADDQYLSELLSEEKATMQRERRRGRVRIWRPHLDSICEH